MPEGPEIRLAADLLQRAIAGKALLGVYFKFDALKPYEHPLAASRVLQFETRGKALLTHFGCELTVYSHNQLYGLWKISKTGTSPTGTRDLRFSIAANDRQALLFSASDISVHATSEIDAHPFICKLGPDVLDSRLCANMLHQRLQLPQFSGKSVAGLLLDQGFLAGMGNYLRSEVLFEAQIAPKATPKALSESAQLRLAQALIDVPQRSYRSRGVTNLRALADSKPIVRRGQSEYETYRFAIFERDGLPCYECCTQIERIEISSRRVYFCPSCQAA
jgi:endonuclease VIII